MNSKGEKVMKFREHRRSFAESMNTCVEIPANMEALVRHLHNVRTKSGIGSDTVGVLKVELYFIKEQSHHLMNNAQWDKTYIVTEDGNAIGFTDGPLKIETFAVDSLASIPGTDSRKRLEAWVDQEIRLAMQQGVDITNGLDRAGIAQLRRERILGVILDGDIAAHLTEVPENIFKSIGGKLLPSSN